jgi:hypothetical protein
VDHLCCQLTIYLSTLYRLASNATTPGRVIVAENAPGPTKLTAEAAGLTVGAAVEPNHRDDVPYISTRAALVSECDTVTAQFAHVPALRDAIQQRDELQAQLEAAVEDEDYQLVARLGDVLTALQKNIAQHPLSEADYLMLMDRHAVLVQKVATTCKDLTKAKNWTALQPIAAKLQELKSLATGCGSSTESVICPSNPVPDLDNNSAGANTIADGGTSLVYANNGVPITNVQELRSAQPGLKLPLRG